MNELHAHIGTGSCSDVLFCNHRSSLQHVVAFVECHFSSSVSRRLLDHVSELYPEWRQPARNDVSQDLPTGRTSTERRTMIDKTRIDNEVMDGGRTRLLSVRQPKRARCAASSSKVTASSLSNCPTRSYPPTLCAASRATS